MTARLRTFTEAAEWLHISESWLRKQVAAKQVPHTRLGRNVRFSDEDLTAIVEARSVEARSAVSRTVGRRVAS